MAKNTGESGAKPASKTLRGVRAGKNSKTAAGSALTQMPMSKRANLSLSQADRAVERYLAKKAG